MTHFGLGSSEEDLGEAYWGIGCEMSSWELVLSAWEAVMFPWEDWEALCLAEHLVDCLPD